MKLALAALIVLTSLASGARAQATSSLKWDDPRLSLHVPQDVLQKYRNPDGCLSPESIINCRDGFIRIDCLNPERDAILYHAKDGSIKTTHRYQVFRTKKVSSLVRINGELRVTPDHQIAVHHDGDKFEYVRSNDWFGKPGYALGYDYLAASSLGQPTETLKQSIEVWDINNFEDCYREEGNFFAGGILIHNSCVQCSNGMIGVDQGVPEFAYLLWASEYGPAVRGGSDPSRVASYAKARNVRIYNVTGKSTWEYMKWAADPAKGARGVAIGAGSVHFQTLAGYDPKTSTYYVINNNGDQRIQEYSEEAFRRLHLASGQWCVILDYPCAPAPAELIEWWRQRAPEELASNTP